MCLFCHIIFKTSKTLTMKIGTHIPCVSPYLRHSNLKRKIKLWQFPASLIILGKKSSNKRFRTQNSASKSINKINLSCFVATEIKHENAENPKIASETDCNSHGTDNYYSDSYFMAVTICF